MQKIPTRHVYWYIYSHPTHILVCYSSVILVGQLPHPDVVRLNLRTSRIQLYWAKIRPIGTLARSDLLMLAM